MEYLKNNKSVVGLHQTNHLNLERKIGLKKIMTRVEQITPIVKLN